MSDIRDHWPQLLAAHRDICEQLLEAYGEPGRGYHSIEHLQEVFERIDAILAGEAAGSAGQGATHDIDLDAVLLAAWFHDAVYDTEGNNEERSAALAERGLTNAEVPKELVDEVARLVRLTATHKVAADDLNGQVLCDADLGILAADEERYAEYTQGVRREYQHVSDEDFRRGRARILRDLLAAPSLFNTSFAKQHWEKRARANVEQELTELEA